MCTTTLSVDHLNNEAGRLINASLALNTRKAYATGLASFCSFRQQQGWLSSWPPSVSEIILYLAHLSLTNHSHKTAVSYLAALSFQCKARSVYDPTKHFLVDKTLQGFQRSAKSKRIRLPITVDILQGILTKLSAACRNLFESLLFQAAFSLAFFGFFRVGEITSTGKGDVTIHKVLSIHDIRWSDDGHLVLHLRFSKADQLGRGATIKVARQPNISICPVQALQRYLSVRPQSSGPLFCHSNSQPLTRYQFSAILKKSLGIFDPRLRNYSSHSFRLGAATTASRMGWPAEKIKEMGRWSSNAYKAYI